MLICISYKLNNIFLFSNAKKERLNVQCFPFYSILLAAGRTKIDFFSLDIEGGEEAVLESLPMGKLDIRVFMIEYLQDDKILREKILANMKRFFDRVGGYRFVGTHHSIDAIFQKI